MGEKIVISLKNVSKCYKRYVRPVDRLKEVFLPHKSRYDEFWALQNINLEVFKGETIAIVGSNGSGKSTLLQIIAGTLTPTTGEVQVQGRISALLELGSGFNPEFTGRQNVFFNGRLLGLSQKEIEEKFDEIAAFADIGDFIDQPVNTYSSGMFVRLAFSVAVNVVPEILIVDEALSVGDMFFQAKCMIKLKQMLDNGLTLFFVSHDTNSVKSICERAVYLNKGNIEIIGDSGLVIDTYIKAQFAKMKLLTNNNLQDSKAIATPVVEIPEIAFLETGNHVFLQEAKEFEERVKIFRQGSGKARIINVAVLDELERPTTEIKFDDYINVKIYYEVFEILPEIVIAFYIKDKNQVEVIGNNNAYENQPIKDAIPGEQYYIEFKFHNKLRAGNYSITTLIADSLKTTAYFDWVEYSYVFKSADLTNKTIWSQVYQPMHVSVSKLDHTSTVSI
ncbi:ABC transporter ATP-binding protein [Desmonostoc muscorum LEGE 12446]|uniref:ABC transporter ATP-binding protein n=1 Tax=Desmonostoc muscorum LEGE 12446 TaxID=1828758 RepID=A0A8J6ZR66_DESMC|nr:ABC transporter ATP-binding protein [Desmonostoc muscorum]MCF2146673.1 ABC transporter ATP-binding protein [Desmonostoc muscorum LEGE 12446]